KLLQRVDAAGGGADSYDRKAHGGRPFNPGGRLSLMVAQIIAILALRHRKSSKLLPNRPRYRPRRTAVAAPPHNAAISRSAAQSGPPEHYCPALSFPPPCAVRAPRVRG